MLCDLQIITLLLLEQLIYRPYDGIAEDPSRDMNPGCGAAGPDVGSSSRPRASEPGRVFSVAFGSAPPQERENAPPRNPRVRPWEAH